MSLSEFQGIGKRKITIRYVNPVHEIDLGAPVVSSQDLKKTKEETEYLSRTMAQCPDLVVTEPVVSNNEGISFKISYLSYKHEEGGVGYRPKNFITHYNPLSTIEVNAVKQSSKITTK